MLTELHIRDFAIIEDLRLPLGPGFLVFTGETGAGKSIMIDAVEMVLGGRADSTLVRAGADLSNVEATFSLDDRTRQEVGAILAREGLEDDGAYMTVGREIRSEGRSICRVNGRTVNLGLLKELGEWLVDVHGQSEHLSLLRVKEHVGLLDRFARDDELRTAYGQAYRDLQEVRRDLARLREQESEVARRTDMLTYQIREIEAASLHPGEDTGLQEERTRLANAEQLAGAAEKALAALDESAEERAAVDLLGEAAEALSSLARIDATMAQAAAGGQSLVEEAGDLARRLRIYRESIEFNPKRLDEVEERLGMIRSLQRKYGETIQVVLNFAENARREMEAITHAEERLQELTAAEAALLRRLGEVGENLSQARREAGQSLSAGIESELNDLRMAGARFGVDQGREDDPSGAYVDGGRVAFDASGLDRIEFLVAPNPGEGLKPLAKTASGGETSRLMLGLKSVLARADRTPTLIFDEIDQGIGGRVGAIVGRKLWTLARGHQVLCVTHLPQLAAFGDQHFRVSKEEIKGRTVTQVEALEGEARLTELSSMLGGTSQANRQSALELLREAQSSKS
jgi:DNA repair protein RecN (Recombination protein N)